jgi:hypothetical protein
MISKIKFLVSCLIILTIILVFYYNLTYLNYCQKNNSKFQTEAHNLKNRILELENGLIKKSPRIFCLVLTNRNNLDDKAKLIQESWARLCDNRIQSHMVMIFK